jgi:hypothetical protein
VPKERKSLKSWYTIILNNKKTQEKFSNANEKYIWLEERGKNIKLMKPGNLKHGYKVAMQLLNF